MKNIIISIIALTIGVGAFAKDINQLVADMPTACSTREELQARKDYVMVNKSDFIRELKAYSASELATKKNAELNVQEVAIRKALSTAYFLFNDEVKVADIVGIRFSPMIFNMLNGVEAYERIKSNKWIVDGIQLTETEKVALAFSVKDSDFIFNCNVNSWSAYTLKQHSKKLKPLLVTAKDQQQAKEFCRKYQGAMLSKGISDSSEEYKSLKAIEDYLNRGILFK